MSAVSLNQVARPIASNGRAKAGRLGKLKRQHLAIWLKWPVQNILFETIPGQIGASR
jgi:hypothetical protein